MLPSVSAQKPDVNDPSGTWLDFASDVTLTAIPFENALFFDLIPSAIDASPKTVNRLAGISEVIPGLPERQLPGRPYKTYGGVASYGFKTGGNPGSSRIRVMGRGR